MSARKTMTVRFYAHSITKRAEGVALVDSGATENFMSLNYAKWLRLPIKTMENPRKLFNVDGTENKGGELRFYTDLDVQTGTNRTKMRFFLTDLGDARVVLGYSWFAAVQPKIDWKNGWIDHSHLPIIFRASNMQKAKFAPRTPHQNQSIIKPAIRMGIPSRPVNLPTEYQRHRKIFSEEAANRLPTQTEWDHTIELLPGAPTALPG
jgi:hypothetical protein